MTIPPDPAKPTTVPAPGLTDPGGVAGSRPDAAPRPAPTPGGGAPDHRGPGVVKKTTSTIKRVLLVVIGALIALFAVFNSQNVEVKWWFTGDPIQTPLILAIFVALVAGAAIGWLAAKLSGRHSD